MKPLNDILTRLNNSTEYKEWHKQQKDCFMSHAFIMMDDSGDGEWQIGYFHDEKITSFTMSEHIKIEPSEEVFKEPDKKVLPIDVKDIKFSESQAIEEAKKLQEREYPGSRPQRVILILQNLNNTLVWNISFITGTFDTLNVHISATSGRVIKHKLLSIIDVHNK
ncbi:MAG: PepSY domain-containing protein [Nanoarchaeota archaeon]